MREANTYTQLLSNPRTTPKEGLSNSGICNHSFTTHKKAEKRDQRWQRTTQLELPDKSLHLKKDNYRLLPTRTRKLQHLLPKHLHVIKMIQKFGIRVPKGRQ